MSDEKPAIVQPAPFAAASLPKVSARSVRVIPTEARSPGNQPVDIVEVELAFPNDGNFVWFRWMDSMRFQVERGRADEALKALGLK